MLTFVYLSLTLVICLSETSFAAKCSTHYDFDYLLLATQWPESFCETQSCADHKDVWSIHGGWPQYTNGGWPQNCCFEKEFRASQIDSIRDELDKHWGTLKAGASDDSFWSHEWTKHGTCAKNSELLNGELNYFNHTLQAFKALSIDKWLSDASITPSSSKMYSVTDFHAAVTKGVGAKVQLWCLSKRHGDSPIVSQINFCLNKDTLKPFDCPNNMIDEKCGHNTLAYLPTTH